MSDDPYAVLDNARREFIAAADRLSNAIARHNFRLALDTLNELPGLTHTLRGELVDFIIAQRPTGE